jgi:proteasome accessory factor B
VHTAEPAFGPLWEAVRDRRPVTFAYRAAGRSEPQTRELEPWGVVNRHGRWYVAGRDRGRDAARVFRLSRIEGDVRFAGPSGSVNVPAGTDVREVVRTWDSVPPRENTAVLRVRPGAGYGLRRYATGPADADASPDLSAPSSSAPSSSAPSSSAPSSSAPSTSAPSTSAGAPSAPSSPAGTGGWDTISVPYSDVGWFADHVASFGADVVVADPPDLRDAVIRKLKGVLA